MKKQLMYIELKSGYSDNGPAWIGLVEFSKSGQTIYFNNKALKKLKVAGPNSNHYEIETGDEYWVSGIKKNGQDRHWAGRGVIMIDKNSVDHYLEYTSQQVLDLKKFKVVEFEETDKDRINELENKNLLDDQGSENTRQYWDKNSKKFEV
jgi:hypothetical protein